MAKGFVCRPSSISREEWERNWERTFRQPVYDFEWRRFNKLFDSTYPNEVPIGHLVKTTQLGERGWTFILKPKPRGLAS